MGYPWEIQGTFKGNTREIKKRVENAG